MATIQLDQVSFTYKAHGQCFQALRDLNFTIQDGEFVCVLGRSGCGKSTLLRLLSGLQAPSTGVIRVDGTPLEGPATSRAMVFQNYALFPWMTARENVRFGIRQARGNLSRRETRELAGAYLEKVGMAEAADRYPCQMSGGMCQRVAIARALAMDAEILLLDEPFGALDARSRQELQRLLERLWSQGEKRKTVVFVTHDLQEAAQLASRILYMTPGRVSRDLPVDLPYPRDALEDAEARQLQALREELLQLFYESGGMEVSHAG